MFVWTEQKLAWMSRAVAHSDFYHRLADLINEKIGRSRDVIDMGCGVGFLSRELAKLGHRVRGYDCDTKAIELAKINSTGIVTGIDMGKKESEVYESGGCVRFSCATLASVYQRKEICDALIACQFGAGEKDYDQLFGIKAERYIIIKNRGKSKTVTGKHRDTTRELSRYLQRRQLPYETRGYKLWLDQPLPRWEVAEYCMVYGIDERTLRYRMQTEEEVVIEKPKDLDIFYVRGG